MGIMPPASADEIVLEGFATLNYPTSVKLKKTGCQVIPIKYITDDNLARENTVFVVAITPMENKRAYGYATWFSTQTSMGDKAFPPMARIGTLDVKVCRKPFLYTPKSTRKTPGINPGTYRIFFNAGYTDPTTGALVGDKIELTRLIKFN